MEYKKDPNRPYRYDWENLIVGDYVFDECHSGVGSGGYGYGIGSKVIKITKTEIIAEDSSSNKERWNKKTRNSNQPPWAYYLAAFQTPTDQR